MLGGLAALLWLLASCQGLPQPRLRHGGSHLSARVAGGSATTIEKFPYMVSVREDLQGGYDVHLGGGSIISHYWVLTSRQHVVGEVPEMYLVRVGSADLDAGEKHSLAQIIHYPKSRDNDIAQYDICLLKVAEPFVYSSKVQAVKLEEAGTTWAVGTTASVAGWGPTLPEGLTVDVLREATVSVVDSNECVTAYTTERWKYDPTYMMCVGHKSERLGACVNDEGAPLVHDGVQIGVASFTTGCFNGTDNAGPALYTSVAYFRSWIKTETGV